ncbi:MAG: hypothetical protein C5B60_02440 [Chloroflexi bacterium]|nr:MAG: hypothetical protein C5B60_02440 [Chloroflexota bacterium]
MNDTGECRQTYLDRITYPHNHQLRFMRVIALAAEYGCDSLQIARALETLFDLDTATGLALDFVGQHIGLTRRVTVAQLQFFAWDVARLGWDEAPWAGPFSDNTITVTLDDTHYRMVLRARIEANRWDGTREGAYAAWHSYFARQGYVVLIEDNFARSFGWFSFDDPLHGFDEGFWAPQDLSPYGRISGRMHMNVVLVGPPPSPLLEALFTGGYFDLKPAGVGINYLTTQAGPGSPTGVPMFAWDWGEPATPPEHLIFQWDTPGHGWDQADWQWPSPLGALEPLTYAPLVQAGWDIGAWARELQPLYARESYAIT